MTEFVQVQEGEGWIELVLNRPEVRNALNRATLAALLHAVRVAAAREECRTVILTGAGDRAFCAGADISEMYELAGDEVRGFTALGHEVAVALEECSKPVIAAINGYALGGGCELALACDLLFAADTAQFGLPEVALGILPGWGGTQRLPRRVGAGRARDMILTGRRVNAEEALRIGLVERVLPVEQLLHEARSLAAQLGGLSPVGLAAAKEALRVAGSLPLAEGCEREQELFAAAFASEERRVAMSRFLKR